MWDSIIELFAKPEYLLSTGDRFIQCLVLLLLLIGFPILGYLLFRGVYLIIKNIIKRCKRRKDK